MKSIMTTIGGQVIIKDGKTKSGTVFQLTFCPEMCAAAFLGISLKRTVYGQILTNMQKRM